MPIRPITMVGLGSTGGKIISRIKHHVDTEGDALAKSFIDVFRITSEVNPEPGTDPTISSFVMSVPRLTAPLAVETILGVQGLKESKNIAANFRTWWYQESERRGTPKKAAEWKPAVADLDLGAGGLRPLGRLLLHHSNVRQDSGQNLLTMLQAKINAFNARHRAITDPNEQAKVDMQSRPDCFVFGLLAGGTCSGTVFDMAYILKEAGFGHVYGVFLLGDVCYEGVVRQVTAQDATRQRNNTSYALAELSLLQSESGRRVNTSDWLGRIGAITLGGEGCDFLPYDKVTLVGAINDADQFLGKFEDYQQFLADFYGLWVTTEANLEVAGQVVDAGAMMAMQNVTV